MRPVCEGMPVIEHATGRVRIVEKLSESCTGRLCIDLVDGSRSLNETELDRIVEVVCEPVMIQTVPRPPKYESRIRTGQNRFFVVSNEGERFEVDQDTAQRAASFLGRCTSERSSAPCH